MLMLMMLECAAEKCTLAKRDGDGGLKYAPDMLLATIGVPSIVLRLL